jgi:hypothetical protein
VRCSSCRFCQHLHFFLRRKCGALFSGNGSVTNFPFVPTIKIVTTTGRYQLLSSDMDVNAGLYLGTPSFTEEDDETHPFWVLI